MFVSISLPLAFFASGAAALLFEVLWFRALGRLLGNTVWAGALVLTAFMLGIALGGVLAARWTRRIRRPALAFAAAEAVVAASGVLLVWGLPAAEALVGRWLGPLAEHSALLMALRLVLALAAMLVPTTAMGLTLALGVRALGGMRTAKALGILYAANTFGACLAPLAAEFMLIEAVGLRGTALAAAGLNLLAAFIASRHGGATVAVPVNTYKAPARLLVAAAMAGGLALALEVIWFRLLILHAPGSDENFAVMLAVVLAGIALGGALAPLLVRFSVAWVAALSSVAVVLGYVLAGWPRSGFHLLDYALPLMLPPAMASGALFTLLGAQLSRGADNPQPAIGRLTTANTLGAAAGAALAGLFLLPQLGIEPSLFILAAGYVLLPIVLMQSAFKGAVWPMLAGAAALAFFPFGRLQLHLAEAALPYQMGGNAKVVRTVQGPTTTLQVVRRERHGEAVSWQLLTDGYSMTGTDRYALRYMQLFAWLPLSLHPQPRKALLISYGAGSTARALLSDPGLAELTVVDLSPEILGTSALVHGERDPLKDSRVRVVMEDGRHFLRTRRSQFDIITAEPPPPLIAGVVNLYTAEYFRALRERLAPGGLATYWLPVVQYKPEGARAVIAAFCDAFPDCTLWAGERSDWILMGGRDVRATRDLERLWRVAAAARLLEADGFERPAQLGAAFLADHAQLREWLAGVPLLTDDFPKRIAPQPRVEGALEEYERWLEPARAQRNFESSAWIEAHWPVQARRASLPYFAVQPPLNGQIPRDMAKALPHIDRVLRETELRVPILWMLDTDLVELAIVERAVQASGYRGEFAHALAARALADRDYARAAELFGRLPQARLIADYAACRARLRPCSKH